MKGGEGEMKSAPRPNEIGGKETEFVSQIGELDRASRYVSECGKMFRISNKFDRRRFSFTKIKISVLELH